MMVKYLFQTTRICLNVILFLEFNCDPRLAESLVDMFTIMVGGVGPAVESKTRLLRKLLRS